MTDAQIYSVAIFIICYFFIVTELIHKTKIVLFGAGLVWLFKLVPKEKTFEYVDFNVLFLLAGMMILVNLLSKTGFFEWIAIKLVKFSDGHPVKILFYLLTAVAVFSAFLDNVTTIILFAPITLVICLELKLNPTLFFILEALASNIGGTATLIGDPPNILIGSLVGLGFIDFITNLGPVIIVNFMIFVGIYLFYFRNSLYVSQEAIARIREFDDSEIIKDYPYLYKSGFVTLFTIILFFLHDLIQVEVSAIALLGASMAMIICKIDPHEAFKDVEWTTLFFFIGLFVLVGSLEESHLIEKASHQLLEISGASLLKTTLILLWGGALISSIIDNVPFVTAMIPVIKIMIPHFAQISGLSETVISQPLWWALALGACLGGNGTIIGASANVVACEFARKNGNPITFWQFSRYGIPCTFISLIISSFYLYLRYF